MRNLLRHIAEIVVLWLFRKRAGQGTWVLLALAGTLTGCYDDGGDATETGGRVTIEARQCTPGFEEHSAVTRAWTPPTPYVTYDAIYGTNGMFASQKDLVNKSIGAFFATDGQPLQQGVFYYYDDGSSAKWHLNMDDINWGSYQLYGYIPQEDAASATVAPYGGSYGSGAVLTLNGLNAITPSDVCVIIGAKNGSSEDSDVIGDDGGLKPGQFGIGLNGTNYVFLLFDHLYTALRFRFKVDAQYDALRTIKLHKLELTGYADANETRIKARYNATIRLRQNAGGTSPVESVTFTPDATSADAALTPIYEWDHVADHEVVLSHYKETGFMGCFVPGQNTYFKLRSTYDVYDKQGNLIRKDATAENVFDLRNMFYTEQVERGNMYSLTVTVWPTYLYMLSDPDLDNPTMTVGT